MTEYVKAVPPHQPYHAAHLVITRFNVRMGFSTDERLTPDWLETRFRLFDRFCYPSLRGQTNQNFKWLVLFDSRTPLHAKQRIEKFAEWDAFVPVYVDNYDGTDLNMLVREHLPSGAQYLITSRIDNDDAYCRTFIDDVQREAMDQEAVVINFVNGVVLNLSTNKLYRRLHPTSPFSTYVEKVGSEPLRTIWGEEHNYVRRLGPIRQVYGEPAWLAVVHGGNVLNRIRMNQERTPLQFIESRFAVDFPRSSESTLSIKLENNVRRLLFRFTWTSRRAVAKVKRAVT